MNIFLDNVDLKSRSGPNHFARKLKKYMERQGDTFTLAEVFDAQISFIQMSNNMAPVFQRLDGIYFNSEQDFERMNWPIRETYANSKGVIFQSQFNKELTFKYFGQHNNFKVIHNGADLEYIDSIAPINHPLLSEFENVWSCASSWRPHKRLKDNVEYFLQHSGDRDCLVVAGSGHDMYKIKHDRIFYVGDLDIATLISLYKKSKYFIHLAYLDHCPNVVVDATACGCNIICSSTGGTKEVAIGATIIEEQEWDFSPLRLYDPPKMDFTKKRENDYITNIDMRYVASEYSKFLGGRNENN